MSSETEGNGVPKLGFYSFKRLVGDSEFQPEVYAHLVRLSMSLRRLLIHPEAYAVAADLVEEMAKEVLAEDPPKNLLAQVK